MVSRSTRLLLLGFALPGCAAPAPDTDQEPRVAAGLDTILAAVAAEGHAFRAIDEGYGVALPASGMAARLSDQGLVIVDPGTGDAVLGLTTAAVGRADSTNPFVPAHPGLGACSAERDTQGECVRRVERAADGVTEWWLGRDDGIEVGWDLAAAPAGEGEVRIEVATDAAIEADDGTVTLAGADGRRWTVGGVSAWDADGTRLPARISQEDGALQVIVDDAGAVYPVTVDPVLTTPSTSLTGPASTSFFGVSVASAGDLNHDGYGDVVIGAYGVSSYRGAAYVYLGSPTGLSLTATFTGEGAAQYFGGAVRSAGDLDHDGYDDLVVAAPEYQAGTQQGAVYVYPGTATGVSSTYSRRLLGEATFNRFGVCLAGAGDVNGDGYGDLLVGADLNDSGGTDSGEVYVYLGSSAGVASAPSWSFAGSAGARLGMACDRAGDVDHDGYADIVIGTHNANLIYIKYGSSSGISTTRGDSWSASGVFGRTVAGGGDVDGDGYDDVLVGQLGMQLWVFRGSATGASGATGFVLSGTTFGDAVAFAGDVDADGYDDVLVGTLTGSSYVVRGRSGSLYAASYTTIAAGPSSTTESTWLAGAGDVNGDGYADVVIGNAGASSSRGSAGVYYGYADADGDGYYVGGTGVGGDCDDTNAAVHAASTRYLDADGDGAGTTAATVCPSVPGYASAGGDCAPADSSIHPGATERCDDIDNNCDGVIDSDAIDREPWHPDVDADGFGDGGTETLACDAPAGSLADGSDCDDADDGVNPLATEVCDSLDDDCDGAVDEDAVDAFSWWDDLDEDGFGDSLHAGVSCDLPSTAAFVDGDCDDTDATIHPYADETCNHTDDDCDGTIDEAGALDEPTWFADADGDGHGDAASTLTACDLPSGYVAGATDCDDGRADVHPAASEACNHRDDDCDGLTDEAGATGEATFFVDADLDGWGDTSRTTTTCWESPGAAAMDGDCDDSVATTHPEATETCNEVDDDCNDVIDDPTAEDAELFYRDVDGDGYGNRRRPVLACEAPSGWVSNRTDCLDSDATVYPSANEACDGVDDDCDGTVDEAGSPLEPSWYADADGDSYGAGSAAHACSALSGTVANVDDCDDGDTAVSPAATEACNHVDDDCDGATDESGATGEASWYVDADGDSYGDPASALLACDPVAGRVSLGGDCDDGRSAAYPGAPERCDGVQNNCSVAWTEASENGEVWLENGSAWTRYTSIWASGTSSTPAAITLPANGTLWVCDGTYHVRLTASASGDLTVASLYGADGVTLSASHITSVVALTGASTTLTLDGLRLTDGAGSGIPTRGGAIRQAAGTLYVNDCVLQDNTAVRGGGLAVIGGTATVSGTDILDNTGTTGGGAYLAGGTLSMADVTIEGNDAEDGGGFYHQTGAWSLTRTDLLDNVATRWGGGLLASNTGSLSSCAVQGNGAAYGGGVYYAGAGGTLTLSSSLVSGNTASVSGGGAYENGGLLACTGSSVVSAGFLSNTAPVGGGVYLALKRATLTSTSCDFGASTGNNTPQDVLYQTTAYNKGDDATFTCTGGACK